MASNSVSKARVDATPSSTTWATVLPGSSSGSWASMPTFTPWAGQASPRNSLSRPAMIFSSVDLPEPFSPSTPIFAPGKNDNQMSLSTSFWGG